MQCGDLLTLLARPRRVRAVGERNTWNALTTRLVRTSATRMCHILARSTRGTRRVGVRVQFRRDPADVLTGLAINLSYAFVTRRSIVRDARRRIGSRLIMVCGTYHALAVTGRSCCLGNVYSCRAYREVLAVTVGGLGRVDVLVLQGGARREVLAYFRTSSGFRAVCVLPRTAAGMMNGTKAIRGILTIRIGAARRGLPLIRDGGTCREWSAYGVMCSGVTRPDIGAIVAYLSSLAYGIRGGGGSR